MMMLHLMLLVFLSNIVSFACMDTNQIQNFDNSTYHHTKRSLADGKTNYPIPYYGEIRSPMYDGKEVIIEGESTSSSDRFVVELCNRADCQMDIQMHMSFRKDTGKIHISSKRNSVQGKESTFGATYFEAKTEFTIKLIIHDLKIRIYVNDNFITDLSLGGVNMETIKYVSVREGFFVEWILYSIASPEPVVPVKRWPVGEKIIIKGTPTKYEKFTIDLICSEGGRSDIPFIFRVTFKDGIGEKRVALSQRFNGHYAKSIYIYDFPFEVDVLFTMVWVIRPPLLQITVTRADGNGTKDYTKTNLDSCYNSIEHWWDVKISVLYMT